MILFLERLGPGELFECAVCGTHLSTTDLLESKQFRGKTGPAYLIHTVWNVRRGPAEERRLLTGDHTIQEVYCRVCENNVGWTYLRAEEPSQQYKIGKFILEKALIRKVREALPEGPGPVAVSSNSSSSSSSSSSSKSASRKSRNRRRRACSAG